MVHISVPPDKRLSAARLMSVGDGDGDGLDLDQELIAGPQRRSTTR
jgi:hypothetical protein